MKLKMKTMSNWAKIIECVLIFIILALKVMGMTEIEMSEVAFSAGAIAVAFGTIDFSVIQANKAKNTVKQTESEAV